MSRSRRAPALILTIGLEGGVRVRFDARTREDELRLREYLRRTRALRHVESAVAIVLDELDAREAA